MKPPKLNAKQVDSIDNLPVDADLSEEKETRLRPTINFPAGMKVPDKPTGSAPDNEHAATTIVEMEDPEIEPAMTEFTDLLNSVATEVGLTMDEVKTEPLPDSPSDKAKPFFKINSSITPKADMPDTEGVDAAMNHAAVMSNYPSKNQDEKKIDTQAMPPVVPVSGGSGFSIRFGGKNHGEVADKADALLRANENAIKEKASKDTGLQSRLKRLGALANTLADKIPTEEIAKKFKEIGEMIAKLFEALLSKLAGSRAP